MMRTPNAAKEHAFDFPSQIFVVEFSPFCWSKDLVCVGTENSVVLGAVLFPEDHAWEETPDNTKLQMYSQLSESGRVSKSQDITFIELKTFKQSLRPQAIAWSPDTTLRGLPRLVHFAVAYSVSTVPTVEIKMSNIIKLYKTDLSESVTITDLEGHQSYINAMAFEPDGNLIASVSDDLTCRIWNTRDESEHQKPEIKINLKSPGMAVCWHGEEPGKLLVAEKNGLIQLLNVQNQQPMMSLDSGTTPLMSAHWAPSNSMFVCALAGGEMIVWDISKPSQPLEVRPVHPQGGRWIKFSSNSDLVLATIGRPGHQLKVYNISAKLPKLSVPLPIAYGLSWHYHLPYVALGCDHQMLIWKVATK
ncbi:nucleoporin Nup37 [Neocloeon triangulifer]|uniref:nucleoporin Nup37 n=1 Tax=Neocloeon triangulifer TaxID=2078957 RepID=UPI00286F1C6E|nr:nucleoporin Nup37 [Neocloeon triangulifer]